VHALGLIAIVSVGKHFDYSHHEVIMMQESDKAEDTVLQEVQKGYLYHDKVVRYAKVIVAKKKNEETK
jgi:molecular chaperone GrpE